MVKWFCSSSLCYNNFRTVDEHGNPLKFYRLPRDVSLQSQYKKILKTDGINWRNGHICCEHWSSGNRKDVTDLPDITVPATQLHIISTKYIKAKETFNRKRNPNVNDLRKFRLLTKKYEAAMKYSNSTSSSNFVFTTPTSSKRKSPTKRSPAVSSSSTSTTSSYRRRPSIRNLLSKIKKLEDENKEIKATVVTLKEKINILTSENKSLKIKTNYLHFNLNKANKQTTQLSNNILTLQKKSFLYSNLLNNKDTFHLLCGLSPEQFNIIFDIAKPYLHTIHYPDCTSSKFSRGRLLDKQTELLLVLTLCRHGLNLGVISYIANVSISTVYRIFVGWIVFLETLFSEISLHPAHGFLIKKMPEAFIKTGHGLTDVVIDCTEFRIQNVTNYDLNSLMFSNYKNTITGKALIGIAPHGGGLLFSDIYPGSISDSELTKEVSVLNLIEPEHEVMADKGFAIQDYCSIKGVYLNRPAQKSADQFECSDISSNFDIAATRIHVERFIGRVRDWSILNATWPLKRIDLLSSTWQSLCHIVNITQLPIGPKH